MKQRTKRQQAIIRRRIFIAFLAVVLATIIALLSVVIGAVLKNTASKKSGSNKKTNSKTSIINTGSDSNSDSNSDSTNSKRKPVSATVINTGDIILHSTVLDGAKTSDGNYDFSAFFTECETYFKYDNYATANLEVTLGGTESGKYSGYPAFNAPDSLLDVIKKSGIDLVTTANNHCYDTGLFGLKRTVQQLKSKNIAFIGTKETEDDPTYKIVNLKGIKIGMVSYTYENSSNGDRKSINGNVVKTEANNLINSFNYDKIDEFYKNSKSVIKEMEQNGAEAIVFYMHWGEEYQLSANTWQKSIAQELCNMGVDVIVGGHPHVVQPIELIHSEDSQNTTVCIYSMGNAISNQRKELMNPECTTGHTEDGVLFSYTFTKDSDGEVSLTAVDVIPTWVNKYRGGSGYQYTMYPLENADMANNYGFDSATVSKAKASFERTKKQIAKGLTECQEHLGCEVRFAD